MHFEVWLSISIAVFALTLILAAIINKLPCKMARRLSQNKILIFGTYISSVLVFLPLYMKEMFVSCGFVEFFKALVVSVPHGVRLFAFDGGYAAIFESETVRNMSAPTGAVYSFFGAVLYIFAPMLTIKFVLSLFKDFAAYQRYAFSGKKHIHVFSELNEKSLALAKSIDSKFNKKAVSPQKYRFSKPALIVFTGVFEERIKNGALLEEAKEIDALALKKDFCAVKFTGQKRNKRKISFYLMSENDEDNFRYTEDVIKRYDFDGIDARVFTKDVRTELLISAADFKNLKMIRVNEAQSLVYHNLDINGLRLFENARVKENGEKLISAVVVGLGDVGTEMVKALSWFCQMDGYNVKIKAFDKDMSARERFVSICPELMDERINGKKIPGEANYEIDVVGGIDLKGTRFTEELAKVNDATYVFVCLDNDVDNLELSIKIRTVYEQIAFENGKKPDIQTVIKDSAITDSMSEKWDCDGGLDSGAGVTNFKNEPYRINMFGSLEQLYSADLVLNSSLIFDAEVANAKYALTVFEEELKNASRLPDGEIEAEKVKIRKRYKDNLRAFYRFDYNYRSSLSRIIHRKKCVELGLESNEQEHKRWNAYMRSEGYRYSGSTDKATRNDLGKLHNNLVPYSYLAESETKKDN